MTGSFAPFFVLAAVSALKRFPVLNASVEGDAVVYWKTINVGIAAVGLGARSRRAADAQGRIVSNMKHLPAAMW